MAGFTVNAENAERFPETCVFISFQDAYDSSATHMWAANYAKVGYPLKGLQQYSAFGVDPSAAARFLPVREGSLRFRGGC